MFRTTLSRLSCWFAFALATALPPLSAHAQTQTPPQFVNASTCAFNNNAAGLSVVGPYLYGSSGVAYCNLTPPGHNYGEAIPTPNTVTVSGYSLQGGSVSSQVCRNTSFAGPATIECGPVKISSGDFYDTVALPPPSQSLPTGYFVLVALNQPFAALSGLSVTWNR